jgi:hypothetical protein
MNTFGKCSCRSVKNDLLSYSPVPQNYTEDIMKFMKRGLGGILVLLLTGFYYSCVQSDRNEAEEQHLTVQQIEDIWVVVDAKDKTRRPIHVRRNDRIIWTSYGSDAYFQFMDDNLIVDEQGMGQYTITLADGLSKAFRIGPNAKRGPNRYSVYIERDKVFAKGQSPPEIIVR